MNESNENVSHEPFVIYLSSVKSIAQMRPATQTHTNMHGKRLCVCVWANKYQTETEYK